MRSTIVRPLALPILAASILTLSCGGSDGGSGVVTVASVTVSPASVVLTFVGETRQLTASARDEAGNAASVSFTWASTNPMAIEVSSGGVITARGPGNATVTASGGGKSSSPVSVTVEQQVRAVEIDMASVSFSSLGETRTLSASTVDQGGTPVPGSTVNWVTTDDRVVSVSAVGLVTARDNGTAMIRATSGSVSASTTVTVQQVAVTASLASATAVNLASLGESAQIELEARDALGRFIDEPTAVFTSGDPAVASVSPGGRIGAVGNGSTDITIRVDDVAVDPVTVTVNQVAVAVQLDTELVVLNAIDATTDVNAEAVDALGNAIEDTDFNWTSADPSIATVQASGTRTTVTGAGEGITSITASTGALASDPLEVFVGTGQIVDLGSGDARSGLSGPAGFQRFYKVTVPAEAGELHVGTGGGTSFDGTTTGDLDLFLKFGSQPTNDFGDVSQLNSGNPTNEEFIQVLDPQAGEWFILVDGFPTGPGYRDADLLVEVKTEAQGFDIRLEYISDLTMAQRQIVRAAADRWETILPQDLFSLWLNIPSTPTPVCGIPGLDVNTYVDDLIVVVALFDDEPGGTLAQAGPCQIRRGLNQDLLPLIGFMAFDLQDIDGLEASGQLAETALHELGHVMGVGSLWTPPSSFELPNLLTGAGTDDPFFTGALARTAFDDAGGTTYQGNKVPVENTGEGGTRDSHWRESVLDDELMTGFAEAAPGEKLSMITFQSLLDVGWPEVDVSQADAYQLPGSGGVGAVAPEEARRGVPRGQDVFFGDLYGVGPDGETVLLRSGFTVPIQLTRRFLR